MEQAWRPLMALVSAAWPAAAPSIPLVLPPPMPRPGRSRVPAARRRARRLRNLRKRTGRR